MKSGLPKSIIKKYGISKKAWKIYRSGRGSTRRAAIKRSKTKTKSGYVARRRRKTRTIYRRPKRRTYRRSSGMKPMNLFIGSAVVAVAEPTLDAFLDKFIPLQVAGIDMKDAGKVGLGWYLMKRRGTIMKGAGYALMVIGARNLVRGFVGSRIATTNNTGWV